MLEELLSKLEMRSVPAKLTAAQVAAKVASEVSNCFRYMIGTVKDFSYAACRKAFRAGRNFAKNEASD